jgi:nucleoside-diphosphate-sugar epimerase
MGAGPHPVFVTGATGFLGRALSVHLLERGHVVHGLVRPGSEERLSRGSRPVVGDVFRAESFAASIPPVATLVPLVGAAAPAPWKAGQFRAIDGASFAAALTAARAAAVRQVVYVSVAQPAPVMQAYVRVRAECEQGLRASGLPATIVRPWYVLGPGRSWPRVLAPLYWLAERVPGTADGARRLGLLTLREMLVAMVWAIENPPEGVRVLDVPEVRRIAALAALAPPQPG